MRFGLYSGNVDPSLPYAADIKQAALDTQCPEALLYAIAYRETIISELNGSIPNAATFISYDRGFGLFQITSLPIPDNWEDPYTSAVWASKVFVLPALNYWFGRGLSNYPLVKCVAAEYNEGRTDAIKYHDQGNVDAGTSNQYGEAVTKYYYNILSTGKPE